MKKDSADRFLQNNRYFSYINEKRYAQIILLAIPGLNIIIADVAMKEARESADRVSAGRGAVLVFRQAALQFLALCEQLSKKSPEQLTTLDLDTLYTKLEEIDPIADKCFLGEQEKSEVFSDLISKFVLLRSTTRMRSNINVAKKLQERGKNADEVKKKILENMIPFIDQIKNIEAWLSKSLS